MAEILTESGFLSSAWKVVKIASEAKKNDTGDEAGGWEGYIFISIFLRAIFYRKRGSFSSLWRCFWSVSENLFGQNSCEDLTKLDIEGLYNSELGGCHRP